MSEEKRIAIVVCLIGAYICFRALMYRIRWNKMKRVLAQAEAAEREGDSA